MHKPFLNKLCKAYTAEKINLKKLAHATTNSCHRTPIIVGILQKVFIPSTPTVADDPISWKRSVFCKTEKNAMISVLQEKRNKHMNAMKYQTELLLLSSPRD
jgi:hypothetical protein